MSTDGSTSSSTSINYPPSACEKPLAQANGLSGQDHPLEVLEQDHAEPRVEEEAGWRRQCSNHLRDVGHTPVEPADLMKSLGHVGRCFPADRRGCAQFERRMSHHCYATPL